MPTYAEMAARKGAEMVLAVHIGGLPYVWFTRPPTGWDPGVWTYRGGLHITSDCRVESSVELAARHVEDPSTLSFALIDPQDDEILLDLFSLGRYKSAPYASELVNPILAGSNADVRLAERIPASNTSGTLYLGSDTIRYTDVSGGTGYCDYAGVTRGYTYSIADGMAEIRHRPAHDWDDDAEAPPLVSTHPITMRGRAVTLLGTWYDDLTGDLLPIEHTRVLWRGRLTGDEDSDGARIVTAESLIGELDREFFRETPRVRVRGYHVAQGGYDTAPGVGTVQVIGHPISISDAWVFDAGVYASEKPWYIYTVNVNLNTADTIEAVCQAVTLGISAKVAGMGWSGHVTYGGYRQALSCQLQGGRVVWYQPLAAWSDITPLDYRLTPGAPAGEIGHYYEQIEIRLSPSLAKILGHKTSFVIGGDVANDEIKQRCSDYYAGNGQSALTAEGDESPLAVYFPVSSAVQNGAGIAVEHDDIVDGFYIPGDGAPVSFYLAGRGIMNVAPVADLVNNVLFITQYGDLTMLPDVSPVGVTLEDSDSGAMEMTQAWLPTDTYIDSYGVITRGWQAVALKLMTSTGSQLGYNGDFDYAPATWGLGIPEAFIDSDSFLSIADWVGTDALQRRYAFYKPENFKEWLEQECLLCGIGIVMRNGLISAVPLSASPSSGDVSIWLNQSDGPVSGRSRLSPDPRDPIAKVSVSYDFDLSTEEYRSETVVPIRVSEDARRSAGEIEILAAGVRSEAWSGDPGCLGDLRTHLTDMMSRSCDEWRLYTASFARSAVDATVGTVIGVTDPMVPNEMLGVRGIEEMPMVVTGCSWAVRDGIVDITALAPMAPGYQDDSDDFPAAAVAGSQEGRSVKVPTVSGQTITAPGNSFQVGDKIALRDLGSGHTTAATVTSIISATQFAIDRSVAYAVASGDPTAIVATDQDMAEMLAALGPSSATSKLPAATQMAGADGAVGGAKTPKFG